MLFTWQNLKARNNCINNKNINTTNPKYQNQNNNRDQLTTLNQNSGGGDDRKFLLKITLSRILLDMQQRMSLWPAAIYCNCWLACGWHIEHTFIRFYGWMYKLSVVYLYFFNGQLIIHMILYFVCKVIRWFFNICCSFLLCNTQFTCYLHLSLDTIRHIIFRDNSKFNHFFCLYIFARF